MAVGLAQWAQLARSTLIELLADARWANRSIAAIVSAGIGVTSDLLSPFVNLFGWLVPLVLMLTLVGFFLWDRARQRAQVESAVGSPLESATEPAEPAEDVRHRWAVRTVHGGIAVLVILPLAVLHVFVGDRESLIIGLVQDMRGDLKRVDEKVDLIAESVDDTGASIKGFELAQTLASNGGQGDGWPQVYQLRWPEPYRSGALQCRLADNTQDHATFIFGLNNCRELTVDVQPRFKADSGAVAQQHWMEVMTGFSNNVPHMVIALDGEPPLTVGLVRVLQDMNSRIMTREDLFQPLAMFANLPVNPVTGEIRPLTASPEEILDMLGLACSLNGCGMKLKMVSSQICQRKPQAVLIGGGVAGDQMIDLTAACAKPYVITTKCFKVPFELQTFAAGSTRPATLVMADGERFDLAVPVVDDRSGVRCP